jgi:hypothetical protein
LKAAGGPDFGGEKAFRKESAWLLAETNDGRWTHCEMACQEWDIWVI